MKKNFFYKDFSGLLNIDTLSPSALFYYRIQNPVALNPSAFGCKIAFYNMKDELIYHRKKYYAHELHSNDEIKAEKEKVTLNIKNNLLENQSLKFVSWSKQGNVAYFMEYQKMNFDVTYESVFLFFDKQYSYRINESKSDFKIIDELKVVEGIYDEHNLENQLINLGLVKQPLHLNKIRNGFFTRRWNP